MIKTGAITSETPSVFSGERGTEIVSGEAVKSSERDSAVKLASWQDMIAATLKKARENPDTVTCIPFPVVLVQSDGQ